ncbi:MAG: Gfo/Idh/MocA family oxidoreductase [Ruminococcaceae bacterium]|nr:Gfo/Idh/MocA family oxidoreductase [Oscillospiraceae bacterium]
MINVALIGRNFVVDEMLSAMKMFDEIKLYAQYSRNYETGRAFADKYGIEKVYTDLDEMARDNDIDAVYIASPNCCHEDQAVMMLESGKHVICEKPMNATYKGALRMIDAAEQNGVVFMEAMMNAHVPGTSKIKELLSEIGAVRRVNLSFCQYSSRYDKFKCGIVENAFDPTLHNGSFMDLGVYPVQLLLNLFGMPKSFNASALYLPESIDSQGSMICNYEGMQAILTWSKITQGQLASEIQGEDGSILIDKVSKPTVVTIVKRNGERTEYETLAGKPVMYYEVNDFLDQIKGEKMSRFNELSLMEAELMEKARKQMGINFVKTV